MNRMDARTGKAGVIVASEDDDPMTKLNHAVADDLLYNFIHDILLQVHMEEKTARATTAAIRIEKLVSKTDGTPGDESTELRIETDSAVYSNGDIFLKGNPLKTTKENLCPRCHLPLLHHPTDGEGAREPDPNVTYCRKHPYVVKPDFDIYNQTWAAPGPGRGKRKNNAEKNEEVDKDDQKGMRMTVPSVTCFNCKRSIVITRFNNHMGSCVGRAGRPASRAAAQRISNGFGCKTTPSSSRKGTPASQSRAGSPPKKRAFDELEEDGEEPAAQQRKKQKVTGKAPAAKAPSPKPQAAPPKKVTKAAKPKGPKKEKAKGASQLSREHKPDDVESPAERAPPRKTAKKSAAVKTKKGAGKSKPGKMGKTGKKPAKSLQNKKRAKEVEESESSGTMSSPPR